MTIATRLVSFVTCDASVARFEILPTLFERAVNILYCLDIHLLFLRHDEFHMIEVKHVRPENSSAEKRKIINICIQIQGKTDKTQQNMVLWAYDDCPQLCPISPFDVLRSFVRHEGRILVSQS
jgi:hypothetical protein